MTLPSNRLLRLSGALVAILLLGLASYTGTLASPYVTGQDSLQYSHAIVPETSAAYDEEVRPVYQYDELSPVAQTFVDRTRAAPNDEYIPNVCRDFMLVCDEYTRDELPDEFTYGKQLGYGEGLVFIEDGNDRFLLETGSTFHGLPFIPVRLLSAWLTVLPLAVIVAVATFRSKNGRVHAGTVSTGVVVAALCLLAPYIEMAGLVSAQVIGLLLVSALWAGILAMGGYWLYQRVAGGYRSSHERA